MAAPSFKAAGRPVKGHKGTLQPNWPTHVAGDVLLVFVEAAGGDTIALSSANGFAPVDGSPVTIGSGTSGTQLAAYWCRATGNSMVGPELADSGDHTYAVPILYQDVRSSGNPWDAVTWGTKTPASAAISMPGPVTSLNECLIVAALTKDLDSTAAFASGFANASLTGVAEREDGGTTLGGGGGIAVMDGALALAGASGTTTATVTSSQNAYVVIALAPRGDISVPLTGAQVATQAGAIASIVGTAVVVPAPAQLNAQPGTASPAGSAPVTVSGAELTSQQGTAGVEVGVTAALAGASIAAQGGALAVTTHANVIPTGTILAAQRGVSVFAATAIPGSLELAAQPGVVSIVGHANVALIGAELAAQHGSVGFDLGITVALAGRSLTASPGTVTPAAGALVALAGAQATAQGGSVSAVGGSGIQHVTVNATGRELAAQKGTASVDVEEKRDHDAEVIAAPPTIVIFEGLVAAYAVK